MDESRGPEGQPTADWRTIRCDLVGDDIPPVSLYVSSGDRRVLYYSAERGDWDVVRGRLRDAAITHYWIRAQDYGELQRHVAGRLLTIAGDESIAPDERGRLVYSACYQALKESFGDLRDPGAFEAALQTTDAAVGALIEHPEILPGVGLLMGHHYDTFSHSVQVASLTMALAAEVEFGDPDALRALGMGAMFHDLGKARVSTHLIDKGGPLTESEWRIMRQHPTWGLDLLRGFGAPGVAEAPVVSHHERWDGQGYPRGMRGEEIPLGARVTKVADVFHAVTSRRSYRQPLNAFGGVSLMKQQMRGHFDPAVLDEFIRYLGRASAGTPVADVS